MSRQLGDDPFERVDVVAAASETSGSSAGTDYLMEVDASQPRADPASDLRPGQATDAPETRRGLTRVLPDQGVLVFQPTSDQGHESPGALWFRVRD